VSSWLQKQLAYEVLLEMLSDQEQEQQGWEVQVPKFNKSL
jgi:hypothetical protein